MRREQRNKKKNSTNTLIYISGGVLAAAIIAFIISLYWTIKFNKSLIKVITAPQ